MEKEITLKDIYLGRADGSQEAEDKNFENLFYKGNKKYDLLNENHDKFIISGRKGTGKTILAKYFEKEKNKEGIPTKILNKRELILKLYLEKGKYALDRQETELFIEYTLLCEMSKLLLENKRKFFQLKNVFKSWKIYKNLKKLEDLVEDRFPSQNYNRDSYNTTNNFETGVNNELKNENVAIGANAKAGYSIDERFQKSPYYQILDSIKKALFYLMKIVPVNVIFDDLDEMEEKLDENENLIRFLIDFIEVSNALNTQLRKYGIFNSRIIILIRSDIIKLLNENSSNLNKIISDSEIRLNWIKKVKEDEMHPLMELIVTKIKKSNSELSNLSNEEIVKRFFPQKVNGIPVMDHMLNCSFGRPRDIVTMLNVIKNEFPDKNCFYADLFKSTQQEYSNKFTDELRNELSTHYEASVINECFNIIHLINKRTFWISDIEKVLEENNEKISYFKSKEQFADFIYAYGIVGNIWSNEGTKKNNFSWKYREDGFETPDYNKKFYLHIGLRKTLLG
mgnify:FL=1|nr:MAG TPA: adenylate kinase [Caudoviricetes sp.]